VTKRERYACADRLEAYNGIAPVTQQSGKSEWVHFRWSCPKFLRQTFHEFAARSIAKSAWARAYYDMQIAKEKGHHLPACTPEQPLPDGPDPGHPVEVETSCRFSKNLFRKHLTEYLR
jgi:hypothetical protein